jgi:uncharacterized membrane protein
VSLDDWTLALHVLSAFAYGAGILLFWSLVVAVRSTDTPGGTLRMGPVVKVGTIAIAAGAVGTIVFGIWLAFSVGDYDLWDGWIIAAIVLWTIGAFVGDRAGRAYTRGMTKAEELEAAGQTGASTELLALNRTQSGVVFHALATATFVLLLIDMVWKPGA